MASLTLITFCFLISTFFSRARVAGAAGACIYFLCYVPYTFMAPDRNYPNISQGGYGYTASVLALRVSLDRVCVAATRFILIMFIA